MLGAQCNVKDPSCLVSKDGKFDDTNVDGNEAGGVDGILVDMAKNVDVKKFDGLAINMDSYSDVKFVKQCHLPINLQIGVHTIGTDEFTKMVIRVKLIHQD